MSSLLRRADEPGAELTVDVLDDSARLALRGLVEAAPIENAVLDARLDALPVLSPRRFGGTLLGVRDPSGTLVAAAFNGGNLLPVGGDAPSWAALARRLADEPRVCSSIVGPAEAVGALWAQLRGSWGPERAIRDRQPLLVLHDATRLTDADLRVRAVTPAELDVYVPAAAAMFTEELGISPYSCTPAGEYRRRVAGLIRARRAFAVFDTAGQVAFKADLGAVSRSTCQVQGVWVRPDLRGQGMGTAALAAVLTHALTLAPSVSLYVNDFNLAARRMYDRLGMEQLGTLTTVLF